MLEYLRSSSMPSTPHQQKKRQTVYITATKVDVRKRNETKSSQLMPFIFETSVRTEGHREKLQEYKTETYLSNNTNIRFITTYKRYLYTPKCS